MKKSMIVAGLILAVVLIGITSCEKSDDLARNEIEGAYDGAFSTSSSLKSALLDGLDAGHGTTEVTMMGDNQIEVHCFGEEIDTTFMLDYYEYNDSVMVCLTGEDFTNTYGHMLGEGHMSGGMMGDKSEGDSDWMHHMDDEHAEGDEHFGGFDMQDRTFTYSFHMKDGTTPYYLKFHGVKEDSLSVNDLGGKYVGSFSVSNSLNSEPEHINDIIEGPGTTEVAMLGDHQIEVHCFGEEFDSTFVLDYYEHNDSIMVCLTGEDFTNTYGHGLGQGHMSGGMMGDKSEGDSDWMHHMDDEHAEGDEHFGGFDLTDESFTYSFKMMGESSPYYLKFHGAKN